MVAGFSYPAMAVPEFEEWYNLTDDINVWDFIPGTTELEPGERDIAFEFFYEGFIDRSLDRETHEAAREAFMDYMGLDDRDFPWEDWREFMGY